MARREGVGGGTATSPTGICLSLFFLFRLFRFFGVLKFKALLDRHFEPVLFNKVLTNFTFVSCHLLFPP